MAAMFFVLFISSSLAIWYGGVLLIAKSESNIFTNNLMNAGDIIAVIFILTWSAFTLSIAAPNFRSIIDACTSASEFFETIEREPIQNLSLSNQMPVKDMITGNIKFRNVQFCYPSKPNDIVFDDLNINFEPGKKTALVGESGSGKTTIIHLLERLYDIKSGLITLDDIDLFSIELNYLRMVIGYVAQEPVLFNTSIRDNILFGREGQYSDDEIMKSCGEAYIKDFVEEVGLDYIVGIKGSKLSGGQKQRIAIARAVLSNPKILILDEATSALDNKSEKEVQKALDNVSKGVTTIIIAHRLSTVVNSDKIIVIGNKKMIEEGTHKELLMKRGLYFKIFKSSCNTSESFNLSRLNLSQVLEYNDEGDVENKNNSLLHKQINEENNIESKNKDLHNEEIKMEVKEDNLVTDRHLIDVGENKQDNTNKRLDTDSNLNQNNALSKEEEQLKLEEEERLLDEKFSKSRSKLFVILKDHKGVVAAAVIGAILNGAIFPLYGVLVGMCIDALSQSDTALITQSCFLVAMYFIALAFTSSIANFLQRYKNNILINVITI